MRPATASATAENSYFHSRFVLYLLIRNLTVLRSFRRHDPAAVSIIKLGKLLRLSVPSLRLFICCVKWPPSFGLDLSRSCCLCAITANRILTTFLLICNAGLRQRHAVGKA